MVPVTLHYLLFQRKGCCKLRVTNYLLDDKVKWCLSVSRDVCCKDVLFVEDYKCKQNAVEYKAQLKEICFCL